MPPIVVTQRRATIGPPGRCESGTSGRRSRRRRVLTAPVGSRVVERSIWSSARCGRATRSPSWAGRTPGGVGPAPGVPVPGVLRVRKEREAGNAYKSVADSGQSDSVPLWPCRAIWASPTAPTTDPRLWDLPLLHLRRNPKTTARAVTASRPPATCRQAPPGASGLPRSQSVSRGLSPQAHAPTMAGSEVVTCDASSKRDLFA